MKHTKKALALLMVLVMSLSLLTVTAFAAGTGKIIIENATAGMEYKLYKVFDASYIDGTADGTKPAGATYTIKSTDPWYSRVDGDGNPFTLTEDTAHPGTYIVSIAEGQQETVATWFQRINISDLTATETATPTDNTVTFNGLDKGYYYIKSGVGATVTLTHANETRKVIDKNQQPGWGTDPDSTKPGGKFIKTGANGAGTEYGALGTADIGGKLDYKIDIFSATNYKGDKMIKEYIIEDTESPAVFMHFSTVRVWVNGTELTKGWVEGVDETSTSSHPIGSSTTSATSKDDADWYVENADNTDSKFSIHINWLNSDGTFKFDNNGKPNVIKITCEGVLKSKGVIYGDNGNLNTATLYVLPNGSTAKAQLGEPRVAKAVTYSGELTYNKEVDPFDASDEGWTTWAEALNQGTQKEIKLITNGDRVNEFFTPSYTTVTEGSYTKTAIQLTKTSAEVVLTGDVETKVVLVITDKFGHKHEMEALTFTMKKSH